MVAVVMGIGGTTWGLIVEKIKISYCYAMVVSVLGLVSLLYLLITCPLSAYLVAFCFGFGLGGMTTLPPVAIANFYGRKSLGSIRGIIEISIYLDDSGKFKVKDNTSLHPYMISLIGEAVIALGMSV